MSPNDFAMFYPAFSCGGVKGRGSWRINPLSISDYKDLCDSIVILCLPLLSIEAKIAILYYKSPKQKR